MRVPSLGQLLKPFAGLYVARAASNFVEQLTCKQVSSDDTRLTHVTTLDQTLQMQGASAQRSRHDAGNRHQAEKLYAKRGIPKAVTHHCATPCNTH